MIATGIIFAYIASKILVTILYWKYLKITNYTTRLLKLLLVLALLLDRFLDDFFADAEIFRQVQGGRRHHRWGAEEKSEIDVVDADVVAGSCEKKELKWEDAGRSTLSFGNSVCGKW